MSYSLIKLLTNIFEFIDAGFYYEDEDINAKTISVFQHI